MNSFELLPMPTEDFVTQLWPAHASHGLRGAGRRPQVGRKEHRLRRRNDPGQLAHPFLAKIVGECKDEPNLKQIFSKHSQYSLLITEYVERCYGYQGFFTKSNVAALTEAAGLDERYEHGHVFD